MTFRYNSQWIAKDYKSVEHVAPQNPPAGNKWDRKIYENNLVQQLGNLILLPININRLADNKSWAVKYLYYCHVAVRSKTKLEKLRRDAKKKEGITLTKKTIDALSEVKYNRAIEAVLCVGENGTWDAKLIRRRTKQIKELAWEMLFSWLQP